jgi:hypothetical protein
MAKIKLLKGKGDLLWVISGFRRGENEICALFAFYANLIYYDIVQIHKA